jgi:hypothetical protein
MDTLRRTFLITLALVLLAGWALTQPREVPGSALLNTTLPISALNTTGTANNTSYLRGDAAWTVPSGGGAGWPTITPTVGNAPSGSAAVAQLNDWSPSGLSTARFINPTLSGSVILTGMESQSDGSIRIINNVSDRYVIVLTHENTGSAAGNRLCLRAHDYLLPGESYTFSYSTSAYVNCSANRWIAIGVSRNTVLRRHYLGQRPGTGTTPANFGIANVTTGTVAGVTPAGTNYGTALRRYQITSSATAGSFAQTRAGSYLYTNSNTANVGGFLQTLVWRYSTLVATNSSFFGTSNANGAMAVAAIQTGVATTNELIGYGGYQQNSGNVDLILGKSGQNVAAIDLGANFPISTTPVYESTLFTAPGMGGTVSTTILWRMDSSAITPDVRDISGNSLMGANLGLWPHLWMHNGSTASSVVLDIVRQDVWLP